MRRATDLAGLILAIAALTGCHRDQKATGHGTISGEILPGSVSDAMLPYDSVKSKAPLAPPETLGPANQAPDNASTDAAAAPAPAAADSASSPAPAISPTP